ncbi:MAG: bifunctional adenosylcobinamide kinase/adenosylcobinamide-phosphate guanylyltransferase [Caldilineaceae bacterium]|nr:bifunctional adenosylcobinamide kinase/adenosylcobinamide-phosphate guanylyltransferase [Caldilineaceae bacterium]HRJ45622.1 bifunctional adenosylcobinamide kinase/adenosylcobinamide-phosphate guanylyltransferase [Caldilineaceae bacterium]
MSTLFFILGGARSGKSDYALEMARALAGDGPLLFIATAQPGDAEMAERIHRHQSERPGHWQTLEAPLGVGTHLQDYLQNQSPRPGVAVLDCLTLLIANLLFAEGQEPENASESLLQKRIDAELDSLLAVQKEAGISLLVVSNEVGLGIVPAGRISRVYRDLLGRANRRLARAADHAHFLVAGIPLDLKALGAMPPGLPGGMGDG